MKDIKVKVGIKTNGLPQIKKAGDFTIVSNMLIGDGFHWQKTIEVRLPGEVILLEKRGKEGLSECIDAEISLINILPLETYLENVVGSEMNASSPIEFLKAHAIISRNWVLGKIMKIHSTDKKGSIHKDNIIIGWDDTSCHYGFDVCSDDHCQRYQGVQDISQEAIIAIRETKNLVLTDNKGKIIDTRFSKCCGGKTEIFSTCWQTREEDCLESVKDPWCDLSGLEPPERDSLLSTILKVYDKETKNYGFRWHEIVNKTTIKINLKKYFNKDIGEILELEPKRRGPSGRIDLLEIKGTKSNLLLGKELWIRRLLSSSHLYSSAFEIKRKGDDFDIRGRGWGHGVGLCQIGAAHMALHGYDYESILKFYYPGSKLQTL